ncbi:MAG: hypothetical protein AAGH68_03325 [Pseudomonadota bacterium]
MGYDIHITRRASWADDGDGISLEEWETFALTQPDIMFPPVRAADGTVLFDSSLPGDVLLQLPSGEICPLFWSEGNTSSTNPSGQVITRMHAIAMALDARVLGDDDEVYGADGRRSQTEPNVRQRGFLSRWLSRG